jgi:hypothetical protein
MIADLERRVKELEDAAAVEMVPYIPYQPYYVPNIPPLTITWFSADGVTGPSNG